MLLLLPLGISWILAASKIMVSDMYLVRCCLHILSPWVLL
jgi:hypothetical protein